MPRQIQDAGEDDDVGNPRSERKRKIPRDTQGRRALTLSGSVYASPC